MINKNSGIYCIQNLKNNKKYIGQSRDLEYRKKQHFYYLENNKHYNIHLQNSFNKYSKNNFVFFILEYCDIENLNDLEKFYIKKYKTIDPQFGYNKESGGNQNKIISKESRKKMSKTKSGEKNPFYGKHHTQEAKMKMSKANLGRRHTQETKIKMSKAKFGKNNPLSKYSLWDNSKIIYDKNHLINKNNPKGFDIRKCFYTKYHGKKISIGCFHDFVTPEIINNLIDNFN